MINENYEELEQQDARIWRLTWGVGKRVEGARRSVPQTGKYVTSFSVPMALPMLSLPFRAILQSSPFGRLDQPHIFDNPIHQNV